MTGAPNDIPPPGERILSYKVNFVSAPWTEIECILANERKLLIGFLTDAQWTNYINENGYSQGHIHESSSQIKYYMYFKLEYYEKILDLFRNEKPVNFIFTTQTELISQPKTATLTTGAEPIDSEEFLEIAIQGLILFNKGGVRVNIAQQLAEQLQDAGIIGDERYKIVRNLASVCKLGLSSKDLFEVTQRIIRDPRFKAEFQQDPKKTVKKTDLGR